MRKLKIAPGEFYHIYNRGNNKQKIFLEESDYTRFLFCLLYFQSEITFNNLGYYVSSFKKNKKFSVSIKTISEIISHRLIDLINFCLMPNHFHVTLFETKENGISYYMQRVLNSYTKYFNTKYKRTGHLFEGPYQAVHIDSDQQLLHLSAYIHKNPKELGTSNSDLLNYFWSSYQDYVTKNRWSDLLKTNIITDRFIKRSDYINFINTSPAKEFSEHSVSTMEIC